MTWPDTRVVEVVKYRVAPENNPVPLMSTVTAPVEATMPWFTVSWLSRTLTELMFGVLIVIGPNFAECHTCDGFVEYRMYHASPLFNPFPAVFNPKMLPVDWITKLEVEALIKFTRLL